MPVTRKQASTSPTATRSGNRLSHQDHHPSEPFPKRRRVESSRSPEASRNASKVEAENTPLSKPPENAVTESPGQHAPQTIPNRKSLKTLSKMKIESLSILDNLSTQILSTLSKSTPEEIRSLLSQKTDAGGDFASVRSLFEHTKRVYTVSSPFLFPHELDLQQSSQVDALRKANFATFFISVFSGEMDLRELDARFLDIFVPDNGRLLKAQSSILLELKTQGFLVCTDGDTQLQPKEALAQFFPDGVEEKLLGKRPGARSLVPSEHDFIKRAKSRRDILSTEIKNGSLPALSNRYKWDDFLREVSNYLSKNFEIMCPGSDREDLQAGRLVPISAAHGAQQSEMEGMFSFQPPAEAQAKAHPATAPELPTPPPPAAVPPPTPVPAAQEPAKEDFVAKAARAARMALEGNGPEYSYSNPYHTPPPQPPPPPPPQQYVPQPSQYNQPAFQHYRPPTSSSPRPSQQRSKSNTPDVPHASQTAPTQVLYERARQAATAKASKPTRPGTPSQRRPWTTDEENALMAGLDRVRGPHWSQILAMFGPGGTINESLKDRNQVQLKDKARNLKLFFLKSGIEVPYYLREVTGDLRTRAPAQASRQEAREMERRQGLEDKAHFDGVQGIMALAGGDQGANGDQGSPPLPELAPEEDESGLEAFEENDEVG